MGSRQYHRTSRWLQNTARRALTAIELAYFELFLGPRGRGRPVPAVMWDAQYRQGHWHGLASADELPRYAVIAGYIMAHRPSPSVLDIGCGNGQLLAVLGERPLGAYHGIDISREAISQAVSRFPTTTATFEVADFNAWTPQSRFDVVVLNEVLYYAAHPVAVAERSLAALHDDGVLILAMFRHRNTRLMWRDLIRRFTFVEAVEVRNQKGETTDIKVIRPSPQAGSPSRLLD